MVGAHENALRRIGIGRHRHAQRAHCLGHDRPERRAIRPEHRHILERISQDRHVEINVGDDALDRHGRVLGEIVRADQPLLFRRDGEEQDRAARCLAARAEALGLLDQRGNANRIVLRAVIDRVALRIGAPDAEMVEMRRQHDDFLAELGVAAGDHPGDIGTADRLEGGFQRKGGVDRQLLGRKHRLAVGDARGDLAPRRLCAREKLGRTGRAQGRQDRHAGGIARAVGARPARARPIEIGSTAGQRRARQHDRADRAMRLCDRRLGRGALEMRAFLALETHRRAAEERDDLAAHIDPGIIVAAIVRRGQAVTDEHYGRIDHGPRCGGDRARHIIFTEHQGHRALALARQHDIALVARAIDNQRHLLNIAARIPRRFQPGGKELRGDIFGGDAIFGAARLAPAQHVGGEEQHMRFHRGLIVGKRRILGHILRHCRSRQRDCRHARHPELHSNPLLRFEVRYHSAAPAQARRFR